MSAFLPFILAALATLPLQQRPSTRAEIIVRHEVSVHGVTETGVPLRTGEVPPSTFIIDSTVTTDVMRGVYTRMLQVDADVRGLVAGWLVTIPPRPTLDTAMARRLERGRAIVTGGAGALLPQQALAVVYRVIPQSRLRAGTRWSEAIDNQVEGAGLTTSESGTRFTTVLRDTIIDGRTHWILRDSTLIQREDVWPEYAYSYAADVAHVRRVTGLRRGISVYDPEREVLVSRTDTLVLDGPVQRTFPDRRSFSARQRIMQVSRWVAMSPSDYDVWAAERAAANRRTFGGMVRTLTPLQQRIRAGERAVIDSLLSAWRTGSPDTRIAIERELAVAEATSQIRDEMISEALQTGDTLTAFTYSSSNLRTYFRPFERDRMTFMLPFLEHAGRAFRNGIGPDAVYEDVFYTFMNRPPALAASDSGNVCASGVCDILERYRNRTDVDPRLRDLGIISAYYRNPRAGFAALEARARAGTAIVQRVHRSALGYPFEWGRPGTGDPMPPANSPHVVWNAWLGRSAPNGIPTPVLKLFQMRTGRNFATEFRTAYDAATSDSAALTFGSLLRAVDPKAFSKRDVIEMLDSDRPPLVQLGQSALYDLTANARPAPAEVADAPLDGLISMITSGAAPTWTNASPRMRIDYHGRTDLFLIADSLSPGLRAKWQERTISDAEWRTRDPRQAGSAFRLNARQAGSFLILHYNYSERLATETDAAPRHYAGGGTIILLRTASGWKEVSRSGWVT